MQFAFHQVGAGGLWYAAEKAVVDPIQIAAAQPEMSVVVGTWVEMVVGELQRTPAVVALMELFVKAAEGNMAEVFVYLVGIVVATRLALLAGSERGRWYLPQGRWWCCQKYLPAGLAGD